MWVGKDPAVLHLCHHLPVIENTLGEGLARGGGTEGGGETEGFHNRQVGFQVEDGSAWPLLLFSHMATFLIEDRVDAS